MTTTYLLDVDRETGADVRMPIDLDTLEINWLRAKPYTADPYWWEVGSMPKRGRGKIPMRCNVCCKRQMRRGVGPCKCGGWMKGYAA